MGGEQMSTLSPELKKIGDAGSLAPHHLAELQASCIAPDIIAANFRSVDDEESFGFIMPNQDGIRRNDGRLRDWALRIYEAVADGGWMVQGVDLTTGDAHEWGQLKPDSPRQDRKGKTIKYESPRGVQNGIYALRVGSESWEKICRIKDTEIPSDNLDFWGWVKENPWLPIVLTEGGKKAGAGLSAGHITIALTGCNGGYFKDQATGKRYLHPELAELAQPGRRFILALDQDTNAKTRQRVKKAIYQTAKLLKQKKCKTLIATWDKNDGKGLDDLVANRGENALHAAIATAKPVLTTPYSQLSGERHLLLNERYLPAFPIPDTHRLIGVRAPKGTGKTEWLSQALAPYIAQGRKILIVLHRVQLCAAISFRTGVPTLDQIGGNPDLQSVGLTLCFDSLHSLSKAKFDPKEWEGAIVVFDEAEQSLWHLLSATTEVKQHRPEVIQNLKAVLTTAHKVIAMDADLSDVSMGYLSRLMGGADAYLVENEFTFDQPWNVYRYGGDDPSELFASLVKHIEDGGKPFVCLGGQKEQSKWGTMTLEKELEARFPELKILRIDSDSLSLENHPAFGCLGHLNEVIQGYDVVIASPSIETGVSIDIRGHFTAVYGSWFGCLPPDSIRQALSRVREPIPRHVWVNDTGLPFDFIASGATYHKQLIDDIGYCSEINKKLLDSRRDMADLLLVDYLSNPLQKEYAPQSVKTWSMMAARLNHSFYSYKDAVFEGLESEGHIVAAPVYPDGEEIPESLIEEIKDEMELVRDKNYLEHREAVADSEDISPEEFKILERQKTYRHKGQKNQVKREKLSQLYGGIDIDPPLIFRHDNGWHSQIRLEYELKYSDYRDFNAWGKHRKDYERGGCFNPDFIARQKNLGQCNVLEHLQIHKLLSTEGFSNNHPELIEIQKQANQWRREIKLLLGLKLDNEDTPIEFLRKILDKVGYDLARVKRATDANGKRYWIYAKPAHDFERDDKGKPIIQDGDAIPIWDNREEVFTRWAVEHEKKMIDAREQVNNAPSQAPAPKIKTQEKEIAITQLQIDDQLLIEKPSETEWTDAHEAELDMELAQWDIALESMSAENVEALIDNLKAEIMERLNSAQSAIAKDENRSLSEYQPGDRVWAWIDGQWQEAVIRAKGLCGWLLEGRYAAFLPDSLFPMYS